MRLSIITINYNNAFGLEKTIKSIQNQDFSDFEYIVIDGASNDSSVGIIEKYSSKIDYWISEPDSGIYNAMNKGIKQAKGEYLLFINSGDVIKDDIILSDYLAELNNEDIIYFNLKVVFSDYYQIKKYPSQINFRYFLRDTLPHPASFIKRNLFLKYGYYIESMKICSDWAFFVTAICQKKCTYKYVNDYFSIFYFDGISSEEQNIQLIMQEKYDFIKTGLSWYYIFYRKWILCEEKLRLKAREIKRNIINNRLLNKF